jgi:hypothetical protein
MCGVEIPVSHLEAFPSIFPLFLPFLQPWALIPSRYMIRRSSFIFMQPFPLPFAHTAEQEVRGSTADTPAPLPMSLLAGDVSCGSVLVRKWICPDPSCPRRIKASRFPELTQPYARMTDRLREALQSVGVTTNGADAARIVSSLGMPTTAKTIIRRVLQLPLPKEGAVRIAGRDEWAWKKGSRYGTILVDLEHRRVAALLSERSVETSTAWFKKHPEVDTVSRDRGKLFREAA